MKLLNNLIQRIYYSLGKNNIETLLTTYCTMNELQLLVNMPKNSIYALLNEQSKQIYLTYSYDVLSSLARIINENKTGIGLPLDLSQFKYKLLETTDRSNLKLRFNYWYDYYNVLGYKFHNKRRPSHYKLVATIENDFRNKLSKLIYVKVRNWNKEKVLGVFNKIEECNEFINNYGKVYEFKYATNKLTKEYLNV